MTTGPIRRPSLLWIVLAGLPGLAVILALDPGPRSVAARAVDDLVCPPGGTRLLWESDIEPLLESNCGTCHDWFTYRAVYQSREEIFAQEDSGHMPPNEPLSPEDQDRVAEWMACGLPIAGPSCPPGGSALSYQNYAQNFFEEHCLACHSTSLAGDQRNGAPDGANWDDYATVKQSAAKIRDRLLRGDMPPWVWIDPVESNAMLEWIACGAAEDTASGAPFRRGDANDDRATDLSDVVYLLDGLFLGGAAPKCLDAADNDANGALNVTDAVVLLDYLFLGGISLPPPFGACGETPRMGCAEFTSCP